MTSLSSVSPCAPQSPQTWNEHAHRFASAFTHASIGMALVSCEGQFLEVNKAFAELVGYSDQEILKLDFQALTHPEDLELDMKCVQQLLHREIESYRIEKRYRHKKGYWITALLSVSMVCDSDGLPLYFISQIQDISALKQAEADLRAAEQKLRDTNRELALANEELRELAQTDVLTGLRNRRAFDESIQEKVAFYKRRKGSFSLILLDVDHFKSINDTWGHAEGDEVLRQMSRLLLDTLRCIDCVARYGGEEFAIILPDTESKGAIGTAERCRQAIENYQFPHGKVTASCGVATWDGDDEQTLIVRADLALYSAKQGGRNRVCYSQEQPHERYGDAYKSI